MSRILTTEQFVGSVIEYNLLNDIHEVSFSELCEIGRIIVSKLIKNCDTIIEFTEDGLYEMINSFGEIFEFESKNFDDKDIKLTSEAELAMSINSVKFMDKINSLFCAGIPLDISKELDKELNDYYHE